MQPPLMPPAQSTPLTLSQAQALTKVLTQGGMPELFFNSVFTVVVEIVGESIRADRLRQQGDPFARGCVR